MADVLATNNAVSSLASGISSGVTTLTVPTGEGARFPSPGANYFYLTLIDTLGNFEIVKVTARASDSMTIVRAQDNTTAKAFGSGSSVQLLPVAALVTDIFAAINSKLASASYTAADVLAKLLTVDGAGSGLDADLLDGQSSAYYTDIATRLGYTPINKAGDTGVGSLQLASSQSITTSDDVSSISFRASNVGGRGGAVDFYGQGYAAVPSLAGAFVMGAANSALSQSCVLVGKPAGTLEWQINGGVRTIWHSGNDGAGSGLDADTVDGQHSSNFPLKTAGTWTPVLTAGGGGPPTYTVNAARWERHGNIKHFFIDITVSAANGSTAYYTVTLPDACTYAAIAAGRNEAGEWLLGRAPNGTDDLTFQTAATTLPTVGQIILRGTYEL